MRQQKRRSNVNSRFAAAFASVWLCFWHYQKDFRFIIVLITFELCGSTH